MNVLCLKGAPCLKTKKRPKGDSSNSPVQGLGRASCSPTVKGADGPTEEGGEEPAVLPLQQGSPPPPLPPPPGERPFPFPTWEESSGDENVLVIHSQVEEEEFKCLVCGESFGQQLSLLRHQKQQHAGERAFVCPECGRGFSLKHNLIIHQRIHTGEKPFGCSRCGKRFSLKQNLLTHQRVHGGEGPFSCPACGQAFPQQRLLLAHQRGQDCGAAAPEKPAGPGHQRMHTRGRPRAASEGGGSLGQRPLRVKPQEKPLPNGALFACRECGEGFRCKSGLASHQRTHRGERPPPPPPSAEEGKKRFSPREGPRAPSQRLLAGGAPFQCLTCGKGFSQKGSLAAHRRSHLAGEMLS
ncbi:endothelial zinc finger protein induced by tumor necrosis factor alpha-like isoform X2 [Hemicordylus capensis]|uniref:endothelial zinc finger protein induced by tumor necrosis factor alpha-like isoform X2 n=1 Tax=Hemicordylus capensis TaxID=884348 RepID=UPI0023023E3B|nr:endothelial zinc finger protein induced by tumor necrosis factor alpha-like isoform X2 [Hemicordylus capensis]